MFDHLGVIVIVKKPLFGAVVIIGVMTSIVYGSVLYAAAPQLTERERIMSEIEKDLHNQDAYQAAIRGGKERSILCGHCHGVDGNSTKPETPNLAAQNPAYIIEQIGKFADGRRKNFVMQTLASGFTFQDKVNLAVYFSSQNLKPVEATPELAAKGERVYKNVCFRCHGENGRGEEGYARLAGQKVDYVTMTLKRFRASANSEDVLDENQRRNASMEQVTARLSDKEIEGLAHYIALLK